MSIEIPAGLTELLQGFTVEVLRHQPADLLEFALQHFTRLQRENERPGAARCGHEGRTWGDAVGGGTPSKGVNFVEEPVRSGSEDGEEEEEEEGAAAAEAGAFNGEDPAPPPCAGTLVRPRCPPLGRARLPLHLPGSPPGSASISVSSRSPTCLLCSPGVSSLPRPVFLEPELGARGAPCPVAPRGLGYTQKAAPSRWVPGGQLSRGWTLLGAQSHTAGLPGALFSACLVYGVSKELGRGLFDCIGFPSSRLDGHIL